MINDIDEEIIDKNNYKFYFHRHLDLKESEPEHDVFTYELLDGRVCYLIHSGASFVILFILNV